MTWFKVDDGLHKHRKRIRAGVNMQGMAAMGLWTVAGSWSSDELTDGWVPDDVIDYLAPGFGQKLAKKLEAAGLWHRETRDEEKGWLFHEWVGHQPTKESVLTERAAAADRQRRARDRARAKHRSEQAASSEDAEPSRRDGSVTDGVSHGGVTPAVTGPPTRPDPTRPVLPTEVRKEQEHQHFDVPAEHRLRLVTDEVEESPPADEPATGAPVKAKKRTKYDYDDPEFLRMWDAYPRKVGKPSGFDAWQKAIKRGADPARIISAVATYARTTAGWDHARIAHPATWLNDERYNDTAQETLPAAAGGWWNN